MSYYAWRPYVPVAERRRQAERKLAKLKKKGQAVCPCDDRGPRRSPSPSGASRGAPISSATATTRTACRAAGPMSATARSSTCRSPRARSSAMVSGSELYTVTITIAPVTATRWKAICRDCAGTIDSLVELLQGRLAKGVMDRVCREGDGLFPAPEEIKLSCSCPGLGRHVQARRGGALWRRRPARRKARAALRAARCRRKSTARKCRTGTLAKKSGTGRNEGA